MITNPVIIYIAFSDGFNEECYGCRGHAYQLTGDYLAADPHCWHCKTSPEQMSDET